MTSQSGLTLTCGISWTVNSRRGSNCCLTQKEKGKGSTSVNILRMGYQKFYLQFITTKYTTIITIIMNTFYTITIAWISKYSKFVVS